MPWALANVTRTSTAVLHPLARLGPARFRLRPGRDREFKVARGAYDDPECENDVPARVSVRTRVGGQVFPMTETLSIPVCPYDSA